MKMTPLSEAVAVEPAAVTSMAGAALRIAGALLVLGAAAWAWFHWQRRSGRTAKRDLRVLDRVFLTRGASLAVVSAAGRRLLLGISGEGVRLLTDLEQEQNFREVLGEVAGREENS
jgi:flagellar biogenesis protein FliO